MSTELYYVYLMTDAGRERLYAGVTCDLAERIREHREQRINDEQLSQDVVKLVYYEITDDIVWAMHRQRMLIGRSRDAIDALVRNMNPLWLDLADNLTRE